MRRSLFTALLCLSFFCCKEEENPIPIRSVYLNLDLMFTDKELKSIPACKAYTPNNINPTIGERVGFGGVIVVHTMLDEYKAFDRACPHEAQASVAVEADSAVVYAVCPKCGTKYDLCFGTGAPTGVSRHYLRSYRVSLNGSRLVVGN